MINKANIRGARQVHRIMYLQNYVAGSIPYFDLMSAVFAYKYPSALPHSPSLRTFLWAMDYGLRT